jgi:hypothetical protein
MHPARAHNSATRRLSARLGERTRLSWGAQPLNMTMTEPAERPGRPANRDDTRSLGGVRLLAGLSGLRRSGWLSGIRLGVGLAGTRRLAGLSGLRHASGLSGIGCLGSHLGSLLGGMSRAVSTCHTRRAGPQPVVTASSNGISSAPRTPSASRVPRSQCATSRRTTISTTVGGAPANPPPAEEARVHGRAFRAIAGRPRPARRLNFCGHEGQEQFRVGLRHGIRPAGRQCGIRPRGRRHFGGP